MRKLLGRNDIEDALKKLDSLTMEVAQMAITQTLNTTHIVDKDVDVLVKTKREILEVTTRVDDNMSKILESG